MQINRLSRQSLPAALALDKVKTHCRIYDTEHDATIDLLIDAAVEFIQTYTRQTFRVSVYEQVTASAKLPLILARMPVISVDLLEYRETSGAWKPLTVADFELDTEVMPWRLTRNSVDGDRFRVTYTSGFTEWPADLVLLIMQMVSENFDSRGSTPASAQAAQFSRAHQLALEQYCLHYDAVTWA